MCLECFELLDNIQLPIRLNSAGFVRICVSTIGECAGRPATSRINPHCTKQIWIQHNTSLDFYGAYVRVSEEPVRTQNHKWNLMRYNSSAFELKL